jgi:hypothetical protein
MNTGETLSGYEPSRKDLRNRKKIRYLQNDWIPKIKFITCGTSR